MRAEYHKYEEKKSDEREFVEPKPYYTSNIDSIDNIDNNEEVNIPLAREKIENNRLSNLFKFDIESLCLSTIMPCHVIGKIGEAVSMEYNLLLVVYGIFFVLSNVSYYVNSNMFRDICPKEETNWCFLENNKTECSNKYMSIDGNKAACIFNLKYNSCYSNLSYCINETDYTFLVVLGVVLNIISLSGMFITHIYLRKIYKEENKIKFSMFRDLITVIFCSPCSLAQQYREVNKLGNNELMIEV